MPKFNLSPYMINRYDNNSELLTMEQSQPKTILNAKIYPPQAGKAKQTQI
jgi:hypothetical protein